MSTQPSRALDPALLRGTRATLDGAIEHDPFEDAYELEYRLELMLTGGRLRIGNLRLPVRSWRELGGLALTFEHGDEVHDGEIVRSEAIGELQVGTDVRPARADRIEFSAGPEGLAVRVVALVAVRRDGRDEPVALDERVPLQLGPISVLVEDDDGGAAAVPAIATEHLDLADYELSAAGDELVLSPLAA